MIHAVLKTSIMPPFPCGHQKILFGMGCFWGAERLFWQLPGVYTTAVGYAGGDIENPDYRLVCSGTTNHAEVVLVVYDAAVISLAKLLETFWQEHDPTQGMRQGNDIGSQYRSVIYCDNEADYQMALRSRQQYQQQLQGMGLGITTEIKKDIPFYYAEAYHQQYLAKNPDGYCGLKGLGVSCHLTDV